MYLVSMRAAACIAVSPSGLGTAPAMKIQEAPGGTDPGRVESKSDVEQPGPHQPGQDEDVYCADLPQKEVSQHTSMEPEGLLICQFQEDDSDPMLSPRHYALEHCDDDTDVPPSPPSTHSFISVPSRQRSLSLGSYGDDRPKLSSAQYAKRIHALRRKIRKFEEKFEEEHKYRPSYSDKAANPDVLRWINELSKLQRDFKERKMRLSELDPAPAGRQRSNTLPSSFGSQLERELQDQELLDAPDEPVPDTTLSRLRKRREVVDIADDSQDVTDERIQAERTELQKALSYHGSVHARPVTENEKETEKPLYERYRLLKQNLCRASAIPVIEEEDGAEDDVDTEKEFAMTVLPDAGVVALLDHLDEEEDDFISPVSEPSISESNADSQFSNLHLTDMPGLVEQLQNARLDKKRIRQRLREFEEAFFKQNGRNAQRGDRSALAKEYNEYKQIKAKLRFLEVLISKKDSSVFL